MQGTIPEVGRIEPIVEQVGWKVCKKSAEKEEEQEWTPCEKIAEAEVLSFIYKENMK